MDTLKRHITPNENQASKFISFDDEKSKANTNSVSNGVTNSV